MAKEKEKEKLVTYTGLCKCIEAPMGRHTLEGYVLDEQYKYELIAYRDAMWMRIYLEEKYFETCTMRTFKLYFEVLTGEQKAEIPKKNNNNN